MNNRKTLLITSFVLFITSSILVALGILFGWFGAARSGVMMFCEHVRSGFIMQPANSISNLAFSVSGIFIAWYAYKNNFSAKNRMTTTIYYPLLLSSGMIILGAGSFAMHATNTALGGFLDLFGMFMFSCFVSAYAITRWFNLSNKRFLLIYILGVFIGSYIKLNPNNESFWVFSGSTLWFTINLLIATIFEIMLRYVRKININARLGWSSIFILLLAFVIWNLNRTQESILCDPYLWIQGHAIWHILNAVGACVVFLFYSTEVEPETK